MASGSGVSDTRPLARQRPRRRAGVLDRVFQILEVVRAGVQFEVGQQFALGLVAAWRRLAARSSSSTRSRAEGARSGSRSVCASSTATKPFVRSDRSALAASGQLLGEVGGRTAAASPACAASRARRIVRRGIEQQLARGVAAGVGQRPRPCRAGPRRQRQHAAQHFAQRRAVVARRSSGRARACRRPAPAPASISRSASRSGLAAARRCDTAG